MRNDSTHYDDDERRGCTTTMYDDAYADLKRLEETVTPRSYSYTLN